MPRQSDMCQVPIRELNKLTELERKVRTMMATGRFAGVPVMALDGKPADSHPASKCTVNLQATLRVRRLLEK